MLQRNILELLKSTGTSYQEVLEIQQAVSRSIIPKVQTVSTRARPWCYSFSSLSSMDKITALSVELQRLLIS